MWGRHSCLSVSSTSDRRVGPGRASGRRPTKCGWGNRDTHCRAHLVGRRSLRELGPPYGYFFPCVIADQAERMSAPRAAELLEFHGQLVRAKTLVYRHLLPFSQAWIHCRVAPRRHELGVDAVVDVLIDRADVRIAESDVEDARVVAQGPSRAVFGCIERTLR